MLRFLSREQLNSLGSCKGLHLPQNQKQREAPALQKHRQARARMVLAKSREESQMTVITGRRRIGKTELAMHCGDETILYFFVARKTESLLCKDFA